MIDPWISFQRSVCEEGKLFAVLCRKMQMGGPYLFLNKVEIIEEPFTSRSNGSILFYDSTEELCVFNGTRSSSARRGIRQSSIFLESIRKHPAISFACFSS
jgi:hypothetical protein